MDIGFTFSFICFSSLSAFLQEFPLPFTSVFPDYPSFCFARLCVVTCSSPFSSPLSTRSLLFWGFTAFLAVRLLGSNFLVGFSVLHQLLSSVLSLSSLNSIPLLVCAHCFRLLKVINFSFPFFSFTFVFIGIASAASSLALFILVLCVAWLPASLSFSFFLGYACAVLSRSLPVLSALLSFFLRWSPTEFLGFVRNFLFLCVLLVIVSSVFFGYVSFLCFRKFTVQLSSIFLS